MAAKIPVWIGDYVLSTYGTGAIMSVPAHDQRDWEFAKAYDLPITRLFQVALSKSAHTGDGTLINSDELNGLSVKDAKKRIIEQLEKSGAGKEDGEFQASRLALLSSTLLGRTLSNSPYRGWGNRSCR